MSLTIQTIKVAGKNEEVIVATMPAEHIYPFIIHRSIKEYYEKSSKKRTRYSKIHVVSHLFTGANVGVFPSYNNALTFVRKIKNKPIFLMPTIPLMTTHPDWPEVRKKVQALKHRYGVD